MEKFDLTKFMRGAIDYGQHAGYKYNSEEYFAERDYRAGSFAHELQSHIDTLAKRTALERAAPKLLGALKEVVRVFDQIARQTSPFRAGKDSADAL